MNWHDILRVLIWTAIATVTVIGIVLFFYMLLAS